jgi:hypothetical protein
MGRLVWSQEQLCRPSCHPNCLMDEPMRNGAADSLPAMPRGADDCHEPQTTRGMEATSVFFAGKRRTTVMVIRHGNVKGVNNRRLIIDDVMLAK